MLISIIIFAVSFLFIAGIATYQKHKCKKNFVGECQYYVGSFFVASIFGLVTLGIVALISSELPETPYEIQKYELISAKPSINYFEYLNKNNELQRIIISSNHLKIVFNKESKDAYFIVKKMECENWYPWLLPTYCNRYEIHTSKENWQELSQTKQGKK
jgi:hypothetical protein